MFHVHIQKYFQSGYEISKLKNKAITTMFVELQMVLLFVFTANVW